MRFRSWRVDVATAFGFWRTIYEGHDEEAAMRRFAAEEHIASRLPKQYREIRLWSGTHLQMHARYDRQASVA